MRTATLRPSQHAYAVTYANFDEDGLHFESELSIQQADGSLLTLKMPTQQHERLAIHQLLYP